MFVQILYLQKVGEILYASFGGTTWYLYWIYVALKPVDDYNLSSSKVPRGVVSKVAPFDLEQY